MNVFGLMQIDETISFRGRENLHLFSINWWRRQDFPVPALPITRNLNRKSESRGEGAEINATPMSG